MKPVTNCEAAWHIRKKFDQCDICILAIPTLGVVSGLILPTVLELIIVSKWEEPQGRPLGILLLA